MPIKLKALRKTQSDIVPPPKIGEIVEGTVTATGRSSLFLDLGARGIGIIFGNEFYKAKDSLKNLKLGEKITAKVINLENEDGYRELSVIDASREMAWKELRDLRDKNEFVEVKIKKANKGGLISDIKGISAFLPVSHLSPEHYPRVKDGDMTEVAKELQKFIGQTLKVRIIDLDSKKGKLILSEKIGEIEKQPSLEKYKEGDMLEGEISGITNFGAFVKIKNGVEGLLNAEEISDKKPEEVLKIGQKVKAKIIKISDNRIYLSLKQ